MRKPPYPVATAPPVESGRVDRVRPRLVGGAWLVVLLGLMVPARVGRAGALQCDAETGEVLCRIDAADEFDRQLRDILENGFTNDLVYRVYLFQPDRDEPLAIAVVSFAEVFRLYTDVYYISREGAEGYLARDDWTAAVAVLSQLEVGFGPAQELGPGELFAAVILEINPLSAEQLLEARRWISRSRGGYRLFGEGEQSLFGTFVSLFVNTDQSSAEARRTLRSDPFEVAP